MPNETHEGWDDLFEQLPVDTTVADEQKATAKARALEAFENRPTPNSRLQAIGHTLMKYKVPHWTTATLLVTGMIWLFQSTSTPAFAFDALVANLMKARTARYDMITTMEGQPELKMKAYYLEPNHLRQEITNGYINISDWSVGKMIGLDPKSKQATVINMLNMPDDQKNGMHANQFEMIRQALRTVTSDPNSKTLSLGEKQIDGRTVLGFRIDAPGMPLTVWADPETELPVRIETTMVGPPKTKVVMTNYEFNVELDESLFSLDIPEGYKVTEANVDATPANETDLITSLKMICSVSDGEFPDGLNQVSIGKYAGKYVVKMGVDPKTGPTGEQLQEVVKLSRGLNFVMVLPREADAHYAGAGVQQGDSDRAIFWYKPTGSEKYHVIYADLNVKEVEEAPTVDGAVKLAQ